MLHYLVYVGLQ